MKFGKQKQNNFIELLKEKKGVEKKLAYAVCAYTVLLFSGNNTS
jgi:hypothetical protein